MKRLIAGALVLMMLFSFVGCKKNNVGSKENESRVQHDVNVKKYASQGIIPEFNEVVLGDDALAVKDKLFYDAAEMTYSEYYAKILADGGIVRDDIDLYATFIQTVNASDGRRAYVRADEEAHMAVHYLLSSDKTKVAAIAIPGDLEAYGFLGVTKSEVKAAVDGKSIDFTPNSNFHFMPKAEDGSTGIYYEFENYRLEFYFGHQSDLIMTVLYDTTLW